jgi:hypothetical protein
VSVERWPELPYEQWRETRDTLHMYTQILGKVRLALSPAEREWAHVPLYVTARGLTTSAVPFGPRTFDAEFDLVDHELVVRTSDGGREAIGLRPRAVAEFYHTVIDALSRLGVDVAISGTPSEVSDPIPFADDWTHDSYDREWAHRFFLVLSQVDRVLKEHRARFLGRSSPVHFFWGTFDLALTRYSGRPATPPADAGIILRRSADAEQICTGFWPGNEQYPQPAFFAYLYPAAEALEGSAIQPHEAGWDKQLGEFILPYDAVRSAPDPGEEVRRFLDSTYETCARAGEWSDDLVPARATWLGRPGTS